MTDTLVPAGGASLVGAVPALAGGALPFDLEYARPVTSGEFVRAESYEPWRPHARDAKHLPCEATTKAGKPCQMARAYDPNNPEYLTTLCKSHWMTLLAMANRGLVAALHGPLPEK